MTSTIANIDPVSIITQLAEHQLTEAIVTAAKTKSRASKAKAAEESEIYIADQILSEVQSGKYMKEAIDNLTRIFERDFTIDEEGVASTSVSVAPVATKAKSRKAHAAPETPSDADAVAVTPEKKSKKVKKPATTQPVVEEAPVSEEVPIAKAPKAKKTKTPDPTPSADVPVVEPSIPAEAPKKVVKKNKKALVETPVETPAVVETPAAVEAVKSKRKPKAKKVVEESDDDDESVAAVSEKKIKKVATKTKKVERVQTPILPEDDEQPITLVSPTKSEVVNTDADAELDGFSAEWEGELMEEELSDIEEDEDD